MTHNVNIKANTYRKRLRRKFKVYDQVGEKDGRKLQHKKFMEKGEAKLTHNVNLKANTYRKKLRRKLR